MFDNIKQAIAKALGVDGLNANLKFDNFIEWEHRKADGTLVAKGRVHNLVVNQGVDWVKDLISNPSTAETKGALIYIGVSPTVLTPAAADVSLSGEYTDSGLSRAAGAYTNGATGAWSVAVTLTCTGSNKTISSAGLFYAGSGNTLFAEANVSPAITGLSNGDQFTMTWNGTLSPS